ncbi:GyrI-like domain-containing protein [Nocardia flavorosea]|uniref:GyrI-like domain-containing protein n=1 Tax=Nocardia flavorosea TaxID=53429 RepID=UPI001895D19B|nr:GyrI-like domain-containing protein [Nocardia flavorosea]MBF6352430.1 GyrI-like domain-containing protein [Nocardia flavorosea]
MADAPLDPSTRPRLLEVAETTLAVVHGLVSPAMIRDFFDTSFTRLATVLANQDVSISGPALACYGATSEQTMQIAVGFPVDRQIVPEDEVVADRLPAGPTARLVHHGSFDELGASWDRLYSWITDRGLTPGDNRWEVYVTEPNPQMDPADLRTELNWPVAPV